MNSLLILSSTNNSAMHIILIKKPSNYLNLSILASSLNAKIPQCTGVNMTGKDWNFLTDEYRCDIKHGM